MKKEFPLRFHFCNNFAEREPIEETETFEIITIKGNAEKAMKDGFEIIRNQIQGNLYDFQKIALNKMLFDIIMDFEMKSISQMMFKIMAVKDLEKVEKPYKILKNYHDSQMRVLIVILE